MTLAQFEVIWLMLGPKKNGHWSIYTKIFVYIATSADGFIARADGAVEWLDRPRPKGNYGMGAFYNSIDTILWGRKTCGMALDFQKNGVTGSSFDIEVNDHWRKRRSRQL